MADYNSTHTGAFIDATITNADAGKTGVSIATPFSGDADTLLTNAMTYASAGATNIPIAEAGAIITNVGNATTITTQIYISVQTSRMFFRRQLTTWQPWQELYHTGNTSNVGFGGTVSGTEEQTMIGVSGGSNGRIDLSDPNTALTVKMAFKNGNGTVGTIDTSGTTTSYNVSSDPRLKDFKGKPSDSDIDAQFNLLFGAFDTFNWKSDPQGQLVWGFNANTAIDNGLDMGSEGEGPRAANLGDVYEQAVIDSEGNEVSPAKVVSPAGVDQSKAVPILLAKIEQLERRLKALEV